MTYLPLKTFFPNDFLIANFHSLQSFMDLEIFFPKQQSSLMEIKKIEKKNARKH
jgi:hypothetical protein